MPAVPAIQTECVIIGAGPVGLFAVFELGLLGMRSEVVDSLPHPGGQCTELYPDKPIYDIPALPVCGAQELVDRLLQQIKPFHAGLHLGQEVVSLERQPDGRFAVETSAATRFDAGSVIIAAGLGSFQPRRLMVPGAEAYEGTQVHYRVQRAGEFHGQDLVIAGGGDSALDWTLELCGKARSLTLVHRRAEFRAAPASVTRMKTFAAAGKLRHLEGTIKTLRTDGGRLVGATVVGHDKTTTDADMPANNRLFRPASEARPGRELGARARKKGALRRHREIPDQRSGHFRDRRHQHVSRQEKADPVGLPRGGACRVRRAAPRLSGEAPVPAIHDDEPDHARAARRRTA